MKPCPCGSNRDYSECCEPVIAGNKNAATAEALMRSRYTAYVVHDIDYIVSSCDNRSENSGEDPIDYRLTRDWSEKSKWLGLKILAVSKGGPQDTEGTVEFEAVYERDGLRDIHHEKARFKKKGEKWIYLDGDIVPKTIVRTGAKTGRNDPCPCGSGKKYKHCCAV